VPELKDLKHEEGQLVRCTAVFEVLPDFELPDYRAVRIEKKAVAVSEDDVDKALEDIRARAAEFVPSRRGVADGDYAVIEMQAATRRQAPPAGRESCRPGRPCRERAGPEREDHRYDTGEERTFEVVYPKDHANKRVAARTSSTASRSARSRKKLPA
jgi:trigger factor